jgi:hypothetical protein
MNRARVVLGSFTVVLVVAAVGVPGSAMAATAGWMVNGTQLLGSAAVATTAKVTEPYNLSGGGLNIKCSSSVAQAVKPEIKAPNKVSVSSGISSECTTMNANCTVPTSIATVPTIAEITLDGALATVGVVKPQTGTIFSTIKFSGEACAVAGVKAMTGSFRTVTPTGQDERPIQLSESKTTEAEKTLFLSGVAVSASAAGLGTLASGLWWNFL